MSLDNPQNFKEFWPYYLREHAHYRTKVIHAIGTCAGIATGIAMLMKGNPWGVPVGIATAYAINWPAHYFIEHNKPATLKYPLWSVISDFRMVYWLFSGRFAGQKKAQKINASKTDL